MDDITKIAQGYGDPTRNTSPSNIMPQEGSGSLQDIGEKFQQFAKPIINRSEGGGTPRLARNPHGFELPERNLPKPRSAPAPTPAPTPAPAPPPPALDADGNGLSDYIQAPVPGGDSYDPAFQQSPGAQNPQQLPMEGGQSAPDGQQAQGMPAELSDEQQLWQDVKGPLYNFAKTEPSWVMGAQSLNELLGKQRVGASGWMRQPIYRRPVGGQPFNIRGTQWLNRPATAMARGTRDYALKPIADTAVGAYRGGTNAARYLGNKAAPTVIKSIADANKLRQAADVAKLTRSTTTGVNATRAFQAAKPLSKFLKVVPGVSTAVESGFLLNDIHNKASNPGDNRGAFDRYWDGSLAQGHEKGQQVRDILSTWDSGDGGIGGHSWAAASKAGNVLGHVLSPVSSVHSAIALQQEMLGGAGDVAQGAWNWASDAKGRHTANNRKLTQDIHNSEAALAGRQAAQLQQQGNMGDPQVRARHAELLNQVNDARRHAEAMEDSTADWNIGNQSTFGSSYPFRDAMSATGEDLKKQINEMKARNGAPPPGGYQPSSSVPGIGYPKGSTLSEAEKLDLENMGYRQRGLERMQKQYDKEVGYWGDGQMPGIVRENVQSAKRRIIDIGKRLREPAVAQDPRLSAQLQADLRHHAQRLDDFERWSQAAR